MSVNTYAGLMKRGSDANKPAPTYWLIGFLYHAIDTGNLYYYADSTTRVLLQGAEKAEILKNKTFDFADNTVIGLMKDPFVTMKREGFLTPAPTAQGSLNLALKGLPPVGNYSLIRDTVEGYVSRFSLPTGGNIGYISNASVNFVTRRGYNPRLKIRCRTPNLDATNIMIGYSTYLPVPTSSWAVDPSNAGAIFAMTASWVDYVIRTSNGTNHIHYNTGVNKVTDFITFEIIMSATDIKFYINDVLRSTQTTNIPALDLDIYLTIQEQKSVGSKDFDISKIYFRDDITAV